ncbi:uncharacterized protein BP01DRAFT_387237 [Aspergillus saccharolyticus JOP 1030-1]|uniref:Uncharacterized protein n=1 Tax=Aspergillus saccharolyticus JOP 1030-1 TaxID=1450539 RepID=A0A318ZAR7_9EURO|nr:hypothetical protein BP01DRAFT_387237 [Aspergillus saccharolyticus JOP 1030-1]PYH40570.1 hypothetical protein BP01DRAFT_387237 [Aspergillus saccharolyticus JOP 1030-1]
MKVRGHRSRARHNNNRRHKPTTRAMGRKNSSTSRKGGLARVDWPQGDQECPECIIHVENCLHGACRERNHGATNLSASASGGTGTVLAVMIWVGVDESPTFFSPLEGVLRVLGVRILQAYPGRAPY